VSQCLSDEIPARSRSNNGATKTRNRSATPVKPEKNLGAAHSRMESLHSTPNALYSYCDTASSFRRHSSAHS